MAVGRYASRLRPVQRQSIGSLLSKASRGLVIGAALILAACSRPEPDRVVLVTIDTLRADHVGAYGSQRAKTATLDALAREGVRFDTALSPVPLTLPSHTTLMTALDPPRHGVRHNSIFVVPPELPTLAERLRASGRATAAFVGALVLHSRFGLDRGFDVYDDRMGDRRSGFIGFAERPADQVVDAALGWLETAPYRFFLWVHFYDPHALYEPPMAYALSFASSPYDGEIAFTDAQLGRLLRAIDERFGPDGTLVAVTADHGESLGEHGEPTHSYSIYDATQHVPLILKGPGLPAGKGVPEVVRLSDVAPTILALLGLPSLGDVDGRDLLPLVEGRRDAPRRAYMETLATQMDMGWAPLFGLRDAGAKAIRAPTPELYDLAADPGERENRAAEDPARFASLDGPLGEILAQAKPLAAPAPLPDAERLRLESLGYVVPRAEDVARAARGAEGPDPKDEIGVLTVMTKASVLIQKGRPAEAYEVLREAGDRGTQLVSLRALAALAAGRLEDAERDARAAAAANPERGDLHQILGDALLRLGRSAEARESLERARDLSPGQSRPLLSLGQLAEGTGDPEAAMRQYRLALDASRMREESPEAAWRLAALLLEQGQGDEADRILAGLPKAEAEAEPAAVRIARAELSAGRTEAALRRLEAARALHADSVPLLLLAGHAFERAGRWDDALAARERVLVLEPEAAVAKNDVAWSLARSGGDLDRALQLAEQARAAAPTAPEVLDTLAVVRLRRGEPQQALGVLGEPAASAPDAPAVLSLRRAEALLALGRRGEARRALDQALAGLRPPLPAWTEGAEPLARQLGAPWPPAR